MLVVGQGAIGTAIEARLTPFECAVVRVARSAREGVHAVSELPALLPDADVVVLALPLTDETRGLVDAAFLAAMKEGALLVNVARGAIVDTSALLAALEAERIRAALDVVDPEPLPAGEPFVGRARAADLPTRRRLEQRDVAARVPVGAAPAPPDRGRPGACEHHDRRLLTSA